MSSGAPARSRARNKPPQYRGRRRGSQSNNNSNSQPRADKRVSPLETALDKSAATTVEPRTFAELGLPAAIVDRLADPGDHDSHRRPEPHDPRRVDRSRHPGPGPDRFRQDPGVRPSDGGTGGRGSAVVAGHPRALVLAPTRELAQQVADSVGAMANSVNLSVVAIYGGASMDRQVKALRRGVDIVVATPGRLEDHIRRGTCNLSRVNTFVIDEADHMADLGFLPAVTRIIDAIPASAQRMLFSATLDRGIEKLATQHLTDPAIHAAAVGTPAAETMEHRAFTLDSDAQARRGGQGRQPARAHAVLRAHQARRRPPGQATAAAGHRDRVDPRQPQPGAAATGPGRLRVGAPTRCWWRPTWPRAASTSTTSTWWSTSIRRLTTRTTCTAAGAPRAPAGRVSSCPCCCRTRLPSTAACTVTPGRTITPSPSTRITLR